MSKQHRNRKKLILAGILFLALLFCVPASAKAGWVKNANGTLSYVNANGKKVKNRWVGGTYYLNSKGVLQKGWLYKGGKWYYFAKSGKVLKNTWLRSGKYMYYAGSTGALYTNGRYKIGDYYYAFNARGTRVTGRRTYGGKTYYFGTKTGRMQTNIWVPTSKKYYYYGSDGVMAKNQWVDRYYVGKYGTRLKSQWKDNCYLNKNGLALVGLQKVSGSWYFFNTKTYKKVTNTTLVIKGVTYKFDSNGKGKVVTTSSIPAATVSVESTYYTDPDVDDTTLLAAIIHCEAGNQSQAGKTAVGLVIMNRVYNNSFPSTLREIIYQKTQFTPARNGALTKILKNPSLMYDGCKEAAQEIITQFKTYKKGQAVKLKIDGEEVDFPYLFFMTKSAYASLGLTSQYKQIGAHVFFTKWC